MKCDFPRGEDTCKRCKNGGHVCIVEGRKRGGTPKLVIPHVFMSCFFFLLSSGMTYIRILLGGRA